MKPIRFRTSSVFLCPAIVAVNVLVFIGWYMMDHEFMTQNFLISWRHLEQGQYQALLGAMFSHNMLWHLLLNMFVLMSFGPPLERILGQARFFAFYIVAGLVSSMAHAYVSFNLLDSPNLPALGASGAIAGVILVFALIFPKEKILLFGIIPLPAIVGALGFIAIDLWGLSVQAEGGGLPIGHGAHLGGAFTGILYYTWWRFR